MISAKTIEEYFGTLQQSMVEGWKAHLKTDKYSSHKALNDFYDEIVDLVDTLIENYQGIHGKVKDLKNVMEEGKLGTIEYFETLRTFTEEGAKQFCKESELKSDVDAILSCIDSTLYQLKELKEERFIPLTEFLNESIGK